MGPILQYGWFLWSCPWIFHGLFYFSIHQVFKRKKKYEAAENKKSGRSVCPQAVLCRGLRPGPVVNPARWDAAACLERMQKALAGGNYSVLRQIRMDCYDSTLRAVKEGAYYVSGPDGRETAVRLELSPAIMEHAVFFTNERSETLLRTSAEKMAKLQTASAVRVSNGDSIDAARAIQRKTGETPLVLNMASWRNPGGGVTSGAGAQEESLFRRSDYFRSLYQFADYAEQYAEYGVRPNPLYRYPLDEKAGAVYSPEVTVFREGELSGFAFIQEPFRLDFVAVAALNFRNSISSLVHLPDGRLRLPPDCAELTRNKIRTILRIACFSGHKRLVLSALGCGAFANPPEHIAEIFRDVLRESEFAGCFSEIVFAVLNDHNGANNYEVFKRTFPDS